MTRFDDALAGVTKMREAADDLLAENLRLSRENEQLRVEKEDQSTSLRTAERENELLRARIDELSVFSDDIADAERDRLRDLDFAKSEDRQDRGARD